MEINFCGIPSHYKKFLGVPIHNYLTFDNNLQPLKRWKIEIDSEDPPDITQEDIDILLTVTGVTVRKVCNIGFLSKLMSYMKNLVKFELTRINFIPPNNFFSCNPNIKYIDLSFNHITSIPNGLFNGLTELQKLNLRSNNIESISADMFTGLINLIELDLAFNRLKTIPAHTFNGLTKLNVLLLGNNELRTLEINSFRGLRGLHKLELNNNILTIPCGVFNDLIELTELNLKYNVLKHIPLGIFDSLRNLFSLILINNHLTRLQLPIFLKNVNILIDNYVGVTYYTRK